MQQRVLFHDKEWNLQSFCETVLFRAAFCFSKAKNEKKICIVFALVLQKGAANSLKRQKQIQAALVFFFKRKILFWSTKKLICCDSRNPVVERDALDLQKVSKNLLRVYIHPKVNDILLNQSVDSTIFMSIDYNEQKKAATTLRLLVLPKRLVHWCVCVLSTNEFYLEYVNGKKFSFPYGLGCAGFCHAATAAEERQERPKSVFYISV